MTWSEANQYCLDNHGTSLATITSDDDATEIKDLMASAAYNYIWIGLNEIETAGDWVWASGYECDGDCADLDWWCDDEPNSAGEQCAEFLGPDTPYLAVSGERPISYSLNDKNCAASRYFICDGYLVTNPTTTSSPSAKCDTFEIDEFLVDCSAEYEGTGNDISELKTDVQSLKDAVKQIEQHLDDVRQSLSHINFQYLDDDTSEENVQLWTFSGKDLWIIGLVVVNVVLVIAALIMMSTKGQKKGKYGPVSVYDSSTGIEK